MTLLHDTALFCITVTGGMALVLLVALWLPSMAQRLVFGTCDLLLCIPLWIAAVITGLVCRMFIFAVLLVRHALAGRNADRRQQSSLRRAAELNHSVVRRVA